MVKIYGAGIIIYYIDEQTKAIKILIGDESQFLSDIQGNSLHKLDPTLNIDELEKPVEDNPGIYDNFNQKAQFIETRLKNTSIGKIRFSVEQLQDGTYKPVFRFLPNEVIASIFKDVKNHRFPVRGIFKSGIIKGHREKGEPDDITILREVHEEVGIELQKEDIKEFAKIENKGNYSDEIYTIFTHLIPLEKVPDIIRQVSQVNKKRLGEVYNLGFVDMNDINLKQLNFISKTSINKFKNYMDWKIRFNKV